MLKESSPATAWFISHTSLTNHRHHSILHIHQPPISGNVTTLDSLRKREVNLSILDKACPSDQNTKKLRLPPALHISLKETAWSTKEVLCPLLSRMANWHLPEAYVSPTSSNLGILQQRTAIWQPQIVRCFSSFRHCTASGFHGFQWHSVDRCRLAG